MLEKDATLGNVKHAVLLKVAELAFKGELDEKEDQIPYEIIPGPKPSSVAVSTVNGKSSVNVYGLQKG